MPITDVTIQTAPICSGSSIIVSQQSAAESTLRVVSSASSSCNRTNLCYSFSFSFSFSFFHFHSIPSTSIRSIPFPPFRKPSPFLSPDPVPVLSESRIRIQLILSIESIRFYSFLSIPSFNSSLFIHSRSPFLSPVVRIPIRLLSFPLRLHFHLFVSFVLFIPIALG